MDELRPSNENQTTETLTEREMMEIFFGPNANKFLNLYDAQISKTKAKFSSSFNLSVLFLSLPWCFYRKLYVIGVAILVVPIILVMIFPDLAGVSMSGIAGALAVTINGLYVSISIKKVKKLRNLYSDTDELKKRLAAAGGTSPISAVLGLLIIASIVAIPFIEKTSISLPKCDNADAQELAGQLVIQSLSKTDLDTSNLIISNFQTVKQIENEKHICSFSVELDDEKTMIYSAITWQNKEEKQYQVQISTDLENL